jgi:hypothetical protein
MLDLEFIEVVLRPAKDLKYYRCKLFEGRLVCDLKVPIPIGKYEFGISRIAASVLYAEFEDDVRCAVPASPIFLRPESAPLIVRPCPSSATSGASNFVVLRDPYGESRVLLCQLQNSAPPT